MDASLVQQKPHLLTIEDTEDQSRYDLLNIGVNTSTVALKTITSENMGQIMNTTMASISQKNVHSPKQNGATKMGQVPKEDHTISIYPQH